HFTISGLPAGTYHLEIAPPNDSWYVRVVEKQDLPAGRATPAGGGSQRSPNPQTRPATAGKAPSAGSGIEVKAGQALENISMTLSEGAARLAGRVSAQAAKNASAQDSAATLRAYLVPSGPAEQKNPLCFLESAVNHDGSFEVSRIPPGKYHLVLRPDPPIKEQLGPIRKAAWDISLQRKLISQAQKQTAELELSTCGRVTGYSLDPVPSAPAPTPAAPRD
ncbi:MAG TPA: hypothetical protein VLZ81_09105, partial [Blastocatellia bacterium]|nr:hypothetical protein [Blastocatellia bacterium]